MTLNPMSPRPRRLASIDAFRAITMLLMIFVNDLVLDLGIPDWLEHAREGEDRLGLETGCKDRYTSDRTSDHLQDGTALIAATLAVRPEKLSGRTCP